MPGRPFPGSPPGPGASWRDALGAFFIWQSTSLVVARASMLGLFAKKAAFLRTPKTSEPSASSSTPTSTPTPSPGTSAGSSPPAPAPSGSTSP